MKRSILLTVSALTTALAARNVSAMGVYTNFAVVAWAPDGAAALVTRTTSSSGTVGSSVVYQLVDASRTPRAFTFFDTTDPDTASQKIDAKACAKSADDLAKALAAKKFKGVTVDPSRCKTAERHLVTVTAEQAQLVALSYVATPTASPAHEPTPREKAAVGALAAEQRTSEVDALALTDALVLVLYGDNGDSSTPAHAAVYAHGKRVIDDLR